MSYSTILFDLDGTLLDTLQDLYLSTNHILALNKMPPRTLDEIRQFVGNGARRLVSRAMDIPETDSNFETYMAQFQSYYSVHCNDHTQPYPDLLPVLRTLRQAGKQLGVISNKPDYGVKALNEIYFSDLMSVAIGQSPSVRCKPAPDTVLQAISLLNADPADCIYIGDSDVDIQTARNAHIPCISVTWGFRDRAFLLKNGATHCIDHPTDLLALL